MNIKLKFGKDEYTCDCGCNIFDRRDGMNIVCPKCAIYLIEDGKNKVNNKSYSFDIYRNPTNIKANEVIAKLNKLIDDTGEFGYCHDYWQPEDIKTEEDLLDKIVYIWQQGVHFFKKSMPQEVQEFWLSKFNKTDGSPRYRLLKLNSLSEIRDGIGFESCSSDLETTRHIWDKIKREHKYYVIVKMKSELEFDIDKFRDFGEKEFVLHNAVVEETVEVL